MRFEDIPSLRYLVGKGYIVALALFRVNPIQARLFWSSCGQGAHCAPFENHVPLVLTAYY